MRLSTFFVFAGLLLGTISSPSVQAAGLDSLENQLNKRETEISRQEKIVADLRQRLDEAESRAAKGVVTFVLGVTVPAYFLWSHFVWPAYELKGILGTILAHAGTAAIVGGGTVMHLSSQEAETLRVELEVAWQRLQEQRRYVQNLRNVVANEPTP